MFKRKKKPIISEQVYKLPPKSPKELTLLDTFDTWMASLMYYPTIDLDAPVTWNDILKSFGKIMADGHIEAGLIQVLRDKYLEN